MRSDQVTARVAFRGEHPTLRFERVYAARIARRPSMWPVCGVSALAFAAGAALVWWLGQVAT